MANTPRYSFVTPSPWLPALRGATTAIGGIMQETEASKRQQQRLKSMAGILGANGLTADAQVYEQMALQETPDYGTAALTGKAVTRDLSMPFDHVLKVLESGRERAARLEAAGIRAAGSNRMGQQEFTAYDRIAAAEMTDADKDLDRNVSRIFQLRLDLTKATSQTQVDTINDEIDRLTRENEEIAARKEAKRVERRANAADTFGSGSTPATGGSGSAADANAPAQGGWGPELPTEADKAASTGDENHGNDLLQTGRKLAPEGNPEIPFSENEPLPAGSSALPGYLGSMPQAIVPPAIDLTYPLPESVLNREIAAQRAKPASAPDSVTEIKPFSTEEAEGFVGPQTPAAFKPTGPKIAQDPEQIKEALKLPLEPEPPPEGASAMDVRKYEREKSSWNFQAGLTERKIELIDQFPGAALDISKVKTKEGLNLVARRELARKGRYGFDSAESAQSAGEIARATMKDGDDFSVINKLDTNTGKHGYAMVKKDDADKTEQGYWRINRGPYAGQIFKYDDKGSVIREMPDGTVVKYRLKTNPNADVTKAQFETWIADLQNSPLANSGLIPVYVGGSEKATSKLEQKGAIPSSARGSKKLDNFEQEYKGP